MRIPPGASASDAHVHALKVKFVGLKIQLTAWVAGRDRVSLEWLILTLARQ